MHPFYNSRHVGFVQVRKLTGGGGWCWGLGEDGVFWSRFPLFLFLLSRDEPFPVWFCVVGRNNCPPCLSVSVSACVLSVGPRVWRALTGSCAACPAESCVLEPK